MKLPELFEAFAGQSEAFIAKARVDRCVLHEIIGKLRIRHELVLERFLCAEWNTNNDDEVSVYELHNITFAKFGKRRDAMTETCMHLLTLEYEWYSLISIKVLASFDTGTLWYCVY